MREHRYKEKVKYGCSDPYVLDGDAEIECQNTGNWSSKPVCRGESSCWCCCGHPSSRLGGVVWVDFQHLVSMCLSCSALFSLLLFQLPARLGSKEAASSTIPRSSGSQTWTPTEFSTETTLLSTAWTKLTGAATRWSAPVRMEPSPSQNALKVCTCLCLYSLILLLFILFYFLWTQGSKNVNHSKNLFMRSFVLIHFVNGRALKGMTLIHDIVFFFFYF